MRWQDSIDAEILVPLYNELSTNVHNHRVSEAKEGWLLLDIKEDLILPKGTFVVGKR